MLGPGRHPSQRRRSEDFEPLTSIKLQLQWLPQAQFAGYYVALDQGYFEEEGFDDVEIIPSGGDIVPQDALVAGDVDFAIAWVPKVLGTLEATGVELTDIAQVFQKSGTLQVSWAGDGIDVGRRLRGQAHRLVGLRQRVGDLRRDGGRGPRRDAPSRSRRRTSA